MGEPVTEGSGAGDVARVRRVEVVDDEGRVRLILGELGGLGPTLPVFGVAVVDAAGRHRSWLALDETGPALVFDQDGNGVVYLGVNDTGSDSVGPGPYFNLADPEGDPRIGWRVSPDGAVHEEGRRRRRRARSG
jgi:hypothetical protein